MKKSVLLGFFLLLGITYAEGQVDVKSGFSAGVTMGLNLFDGDIPQSNNSLLPSSMLGAVVGLNVNYQATARYGFFLDYNWIPIAANTKGWTIRTKINTFAINASINFTDLLFPDSYSYSRREFNVYGSIGLGVAKYFYHVSPIDLTISSGSGLAAITPYSLFCIYDCSDRISIGAKVSYITSNKDNLEGINSLNCKGLSNDNIGSMTVFVKYNF